MKKVALILAGLVLLVFLVGGAGLIWLESGLGLPARHEPPPPPSTEKPHSAGERRASGEAPPGNETAAPHVMKADPLDKVDAWVRQMRRARIAFNAPTHMNVSETAVVQLLLSLSRSMEALKAELTEAGKRMGAVIEVSPLMEARLTGPRFEITAITPERQAISAVETTRWAWEVAPREPGRHRLHLTLTALIRIDGQPVERAIRTFDYRIEVEITPVQQAKRFVAGNWQWLWATLVVPAAGWLWRRRVRKRRAAA